VIGDRLRSGRARAVTALAVAAVGAGAAAQTALPGQAPDPLGRITEFSKGLQDFALPGGVVAGPDGNVWFADPGYQQRAFGEGGEEDPDAHGVPEIGRITPAGTITEFRQGLQANGGSGPTDITAGPDDALWFTDPPSSYTDGGVPEIGRVTVDGAITEFSAGLAKGSAPGTIVAGADGNLWFTDAGKTPAIGRITPAGVITEFRAGLPTQSSPAAIAAGPDGNVWFTDVGHSRAIGRVTPDGQITEFSAGLKGAQKAYGIAAGPDKNLWFTVGADVDYSSGPSPAAIGQITPTGIVTLFSTGLPLGSNPRDIAAGPDGALWFTEANVLAPAIGRISTAGKISEFTAGLPTLVDDAGPDRIAAGPDGNMWFSDQGDQNTNDDGAGISVGRVGTAGTTTAGSKLTLVLTCTLVVHHRAPHCVTGLAAHSVLSTGSGPTYKAREIEDDNTGGPNTLVMLGSARRVGSHLVTVISKLYGTPLSFNVLVLTHGHTHLHERLIVNCVLCSAK
jgi:streptogramin lyase